MVEDRYEPSVTAVPKQRVGKALRPEAAASEDETEMPSGPQTVAAGQLRAIIERIERVNESIQELSDDRKEIFAEAKATGFDAKAIRAIIRIRKMDQAKREEEEAMLDLYLSALGMI